MANYPTSLPSATPADHAAVLAEVRAIATELGLDPSGAASTVTARLGWGVSTGFRASGQGYPAVSIAATSGTATCVSGKLIALPLHFAAPTPLSTLEVSVTTLFSGGTIRLGVYADGGSSYPGALVVDGGTVSTTTTGVKSTTATATLMGLVWIALLADNSTAVLAGASADATYLGVPSGQVNRVNWGYSVTQTVGALPSTFPVGGALQNNVLNGSPYYVMARVT